MIPTTPGVLPAWLAEDSIRTWRESDLSLEPVDGLRAAPLDARDPRYGEVVDRSGETADAMVEVTR